LSIYTTEAQIYALFNQIGPIKQIIMGLNRNTKTPCGFCFVDYFSHQHACDAVFFLSGIQLDERVIKVELDYGFEEGRQYGRGLEGGQRRDDFRSQFDFDRDPLNVALQDKQNIEA
jgi:nuclear cap-binding protein subunit 2